MRFRLRLPLRGPLGPTIRLRLTFVYGALFLAAGAVLLAVNYALVNKGLHDRVRDIGVPVEGQIV